MDVWYENRTLHKCFTVGDHFTHPILGQGSGQTDSERRQEVTVTPRIDSNSDMVKVSLRNVLELCSQTIDLLGNCIIINRQ